MRLERQQPTKECDIIQSVWYIRLEKEKVQEGYFFFPENHAEIIIPLRGIFTRRIVGYRKTYQFVQGESALTKTRNRGMIIQSEETVAFILVKLRPQYLNIFNEQQHYRSIDEVQPLKIPARMAVEWRNAVFYRDKESIVNLIEEYISELSHQKGFSVDEMINETIDRIQESKGEIKIKDLNESLGICKSTLEQKFSREVGITPKEFCKIEKFGQFLKNYSVFNTEKTLTQLTFMSGYYDQSHLIKDFKYYVDDSPKRFLSQANKVILTA